jgi:hypothetical protein
MKIRHLLPLLPLLSTSPLHADSDLIFVPRATGGVIQYNLIQPARDTIKDIDTAKAGTQVIMRNQEVTIRRGTKIPETTFNVVFASFGAGLTIVRNTMYMDFSFQTTAPGEATETLAMPLATIGVAADQKQSFKDLGACADSQCNTRFVSPDPTSGQDSDESAWNYTELGLTETFSGTRTEGALTIGTQIFGGMSGYLGYKYGASSGTGNGGEAGNEANGTTLTFTENGPFAGASYGMMLFNKGIISFNVALAYLFGHVDAESKLFPQFNLDADSTTIGLSGGVAWKSRLTDKINYSLSLDGTQYRFGDIQAEGVDSNALDGTQNETLINAKLTLTF